MYTGEERGVFSEDRKRKMEGEGGDEEGEEDSEMNRKREGDRRRQAKSKKIVKDRLERLENLEQELGRKAEEAVNLQAVNQAQARGLRAMEERAKKEENNSNLRWNCWKLRRCGMRSREINQVEIDTEK